MSTTHRPHPITGEWNDEQYDDPPDALLYDGCERCAQHAELLLSLDSVRLPTLYQRMKANEPSRTRMERRAMDRLYNMEIVISRARKETY